MMSQVLCNQVLQESLVFRTPDLQRRGSVPLLTYIGMLEFFKEEMT